MDNSKKSSRQNPRETANLINWLFFWWTLKLFWKGARKDLQVTDLYDPLKSDESERLGNRLEREWNKELQKLKPVEFVLGKNGEKKKVKEQKPSLLRAIIRAFWFAYMRQGVVACTVIVVLRTMLPLIQGLFIQYFDRTVDNGTTKNQALVYSGLLVACVVGLAFLTHHTNLAFMQIGMQVRIACCSLLYRKTLRLSRTALGKIAAGQVINLLSNDVNRFDVTPLFLHSVWMMPIQVILATYVMWHIVGSSAFIGMGILALLNIPFQSWLSKLSAKLRGAIALKTDTRVQLMYELITGIQVVKMYAWEKLFDALVSRVRALEMRLITRTSYLRGLYLSIMVFTERLTLYSTLVVYVLMGNTLTVALTFVLATFFNILQSTLTIQFPQAIILAGEALVSIGRLETFLLLDEIQREKKGDGKLGTGNENRKQGHDKQADGAVTIRMHRVSANWVLGQLPPTLRDISMKVEAGKLCALVGAVGAGKSSLLHLLLNELPMGAGECFYSWGDERNEREWEVSDTNLRFSYSSQDPWLFGATLRENILFGQPYDRKRYQEVTRVCALLKDFEQLPQGDQTTVGERGATLSGGQRARVNLARAVYKEADVYLLDDPLSAVDAQVGRHLFEECINGYLKNSTRILVTHQLQYLQDADSIVIIDRGAIKGQGTFEELSKSNSKFTKVLKSMNEGTEVDDLQGELEQISGEEQTREMQLRKRSIRKCSIRSSKHSFVAGSSNGEMDESKQMRGDNVHAEQIATGTLSSKVYGTYFRAGGSIFWLVLLILVMLSSQIATNGTDFWLTYWTKLETMRLEIQSNSTSSKQHATKPVAILKYLNLLDEDGLLPALTSIYIYTFCVVGCILLTLLRSFMFMNVCMTASRKLHDSMFANILQSTMRFFNVNPSGRILNRFSKDVGAMDELLPKAMSEAVQIFLVTVGIMVMIAVVNYYMIIPILITGIIFYAARTCYIRTAQDIKRLEGTTKSPVFSHVNATLHGLTTIRSRGEQIEEMLRKEFDRHQDTHTGAWYLFITTGEAFGLAVELGCCAFVACVCYSFILNDSEDTLGSDVGLAVSQSLIFTRIVQYGVRQSAEVFTQMTSVERVLQYTNLPKEGPLTTPNPPPPSWPSTGQLSFKNVYMNYSDDDPLILKDLNIDIKSGWKVGIVGRTGAGKSSVIAALFRLTGSGLEGEIILDGKDTASVGLHELRPRISIIPQEPVLFSASLRYNLDPFGNYPDSALWDVLREVELGDVAASLDHLVAAGGANFSVGQCQLVCLARAILRNNRVLVLDEATANIDPQMSKQSYLELVILVSPAIQKQNTNMRRSVEAEERLLDIHCLLDHLETGNSNHQQPDITDALIQNTIRQRFADCTVLTIAHKLNTIIDCDRVLVMDAGRMVEFGHPHLLLRDAPQGHFSRMVEQTGDVMASKLSTIAEEAYLKNPESRSTNI